MFVHVLGQGASDSQTFTLHNDAAEPVTVDLSTARYTRIGADDYSFTSAPVSEEHGTFPVPEYLIRIDGEIPAGTDLVQVRLTRPYDQFDPVGDVEGPFSFWELDIQDWTDRDGDGLVWDDADQDGHVDLEETDLGEYNSVTFNGGAGPSLEVRMGDPLGRMTDGLLIELYHFGQHPEVATTDLTIEATYWQRTDWDWLSLSDASALVPAGGTASFDATLTVPADAPHGAYEGAIRVSGGGRIQTIPVSVAVAADGTDLAMGGLGPQDELYDNGRVFGLTDAFWRPETGDWRMFWTDLQAADLPGGTPYLFVDTAWTTPARTSTPSSSARPRTASATARAAGLFDGFPATRPATARTRSTWSAAAWTRTWARPLAVPDVDARLATAERVAAPAAAGLHEILLHHVVNGGSEVAEPFSGRLGFVALDPGAIVAPPATSPVSVTLATEIALDGLTAQGFGLSQPVTTRRPSSGRPRRPSTASFSTTVAIANAASLDVSTASSANASDIDLYVYGPDGSLVGASFTRRTPSTSRSRSRRTAPTGSTSMAGTSPAAATSST
jgi:hypothetical protein